MIPREGACALLHIVVWCEQSACRHRRRMSRMMNLTWLAGWLLLRSGWRNGLSRQTKSRCKCIGQQERTWLSTTHAPRCLSAVMWLFGAALMNPNLKSVVNVTSSDLRCQVTELAPARHDVDGDRGDTRLRQIPSASLLVGSSTPLPRATEFVVPTRNAFSIPPKPRRFRLCL